MSFHSVDNQISFDYMAKKNYYVVLVGRRTGVYFTWAECEKEVKGFPGAKYQGFATADEVDKYIAQHFQDESPFELH